MTTASAVNIPTASVVNTYTQIQLMYHVKMLCFVTVHTDISANWLWESELVSELVGKLRALLTIAIALGMCSFCSLIIIIIILPWLVTLHTYN